MGLLDFLIEVTVRVVSEVLGKIATFFTERAITKRTQDKSPPATVRRLAYSSTCGDDGLDLKRERLYFSVTFGGYFASLLESPNIYLDMPGQIHCPVAGETHPLEWLYGTLNDPAGFRLVTIAAGGGMGKTTLAAKIVRCLYSQNAIDLILGDSAKRTEIDLITGRPRDVRPGFDDLDSFYRRLAAQTGLTNYPENVGWRAIISDLKARLAGQRALIVLDNLDDFGNEEGERRERSAFFESIQSLLGRDVRALVTTRKADITVSNAVVINLNPISRDDVALARQFVSWHIDRFVPLNPRLANVRNMLTDKKQIRRLLEKTGGVPLIMQVVVSRIAFEKLGYLDRLPELLPGELLDYLYREHWDELSTLGEVGRLARDLLWYMASTNYSGRKMTGDVLRERARLAGQESLFSDALRLLVERFLLVDREPTSKAGNFVIFPSLREFVLSAYDTRGER